MSQKPLSALQTQVLCALLNLGGEAPVWRIAGAVRLRPSVVARTLQHLPPSYAFWPYGYERDAVWQILQRATDTLCAAETLPRAA